MKKQILSFIFDGEKFLALHSKSHEYHGSGGWFVVTGGVDEGESFEEAAIREVKEETNLDVVELLDLNWGSIYKWHDDICEENNFLGFVNSQDVVLNEEHDKFEWLDMDEFIQRIRWEDDKEVLTEVLKKAVDKLIYFDEKKVMDYRQD